MSNAWDNLFKGQWEQNKQWDPLTHGLLEFITRNGSHILGATDHGVSKLFGGDGSTVLGDEARKNEHDPVRGIGRAVLSTGLAAGAAYGAGAFGGGSAGYAPATNSVLADSAANSVGYGASSSGAGLNAYGAGMASPAAAQQYQQMQPPQQQQQGAAPMPTNPVGDPFAQQKKEALIMAMMEAEQRKKQQQQGQYNGGGYYG